MTEAEIKSSILAQLNQQALATAIDQFAKLAVEAEKLKAENEELKAKLAAATKPANPATD